MNATADAMYRTVPSYRLDTLYSTRAWLDPILLKVDVQGYELKVLDGAPHLLEQTELVLLETSLFSFSPGMPDFYDVLSYMKQKGFVVYDLYNGHNRPLDGARAQIDVAFVKENGTLRRDPRWGNSEQCRDFLLCKFERAAYRQFNPQFTASLVKSAERFF